MLEPIKLYNENHDRGLEILGIDNDPAKKDLQSFLTDHSDVVWPQLFGPSGPQHFNTISQRFAIQGVPTMYVIDRNGILRDIETGSIPDRTIMKLLDEQPTASPQTKPSSP